MDVVLNEPDRTIGDFELSIRALLLMSHLGDQAI